MHTPAANFVPTLKISWSYFFPICEDGDKPGLNEERFFLALGTGETDRKFQQRRHFFRRERNLAKLKSSFNRSQSELYVYVGAALN